MEEAGDVLWTAICTGLLDIAAAQATATHSGARAEPVTVLARTPQRTFGLKGPRFS